MELRIRHESFVSPAKVSGVQNTQVSDPLGTVIIQPTKDGHRPSVATILEFREYLHDVLTRLPALTNQFDLDALTPVNWKTA